MNWKNFLILASITLYSSQILSMELKSLPEVFVNSKNQRLSPSLRVMQGNPPIPVELKIKKPTIVHFWATWCAPCVSELPKLASTAKKFKTSDVDVVFISIDVSASSKVPAFLQRHGLSDLSVYWDSRSELYKKFSLQILPASILIDTDGKELGRAIGAVNWNADSDLKFIKSKF